MSSRTSRNHPQLLRRYSWITLRVLIAGGLLLGAITIVFAGMGSNYTFHWAEAFKFLPRFNQGLIVTLELSVLGAILAILIGLVVAVMRLSPNAVLLSVVIHNHRTWKPNSK